MFIQTTQRDNTTHMLTTRSLQIINHVLTHRLEPFFLTKPCFYDPCPFWVYETRSSPFLKGLKSMDIQIDPVIDWRILTCACDEDYCVVLSLLRSILQSGMFLNGCCIWSSVWLTVDNCCQLLSWPKTHRWATDRFLLILNGTWGNRQTCTFGISGMKCLEWPWLRHHGHWRIWLADGTVNIPIYISFQKTSWHVNPTKSSCTLLTICCSA